MRDIPVGNGSLLVNFDETYRLRDVYFPHVGQENHTEGEPSRFGIWVDGQFSWIDSEGWQRSLKYLGETLVTDVSLKNDELGIEIACSDTVASHENIFIRRIKVINAQDAARQVRIFLHHDFRLYENAVGDTAFYDPQTEAVIHYKKDRFFLINTEPHFDGFATGRKAFGSQEGTWRDAEDGELHAGAITEGSVDSTIGVYFSLEGGGEFQFFYWIAAGTAYKDVFNLNSRVLEQRPENYFHHTANYWRAWVNKNETDLTGLPLEIADLYKRSLLIIRTQIDNGGAILAANDSDVTKRATDHYSYLWTRDGAFVAHALDLAGYPSLARNFYEFCGRIVTPEGYFFQKYNADGTVASSWHALWDAHRQKRLLPIQEDETALVLFGLSGSITANIVISSSRMDYIIRSLFRAGILWWNTATRPCDCQKRAGTYGKTDAGSTRSPVRRWWRDCVLPPISQDSSRTASGRPLTITRHPKRAAPCASNSSIRVSAGL
jgi:GH15 family glucan-1,4-alpha-glucosidase